LVGILVGLGVLVEVVCDQGVQRGQPLHALGQAPTRQSAAGLVDELDVVMGLGLVVPEEQHRAQTSSGSAPAASDPGGENCGDLMDQCSRNAIPPAIRSSSPTGEGTV
jgi:hypothetical protein